MPDDNYDLLDVEEFLTDEDKKSRSSTFILLMMQKNEIPLLSSRTVQISSLITTKILKLPVQRLSPLNPFSSHKVPKKQTHPFHQPIKK